MSGEWRARAEAVIPGGASTGSKRGDALWGAADESSPAHYASASGSRLTLPDGRVVVDCTMALGAVALGYAHPGVHARVEAAVRAGNVGGLSHPLEVELAERLCAVIPCAEQVRFLKSGAEAVSAAVRIARTCTGRSRVVGCGYFGWHDWSSDAAGVPERARADFVRVAFDDVAALESACTAAGSDLAAIVLEPVIERLPGATWLAAARRIADRTGAALIFDEMKTGFRVATGGYQAIARVTPDLAVFGKALANGFPLAAVVGRRAVMDAARRTWISSTLGGETTALAAAMAVLDAHADGDVCATLATIGERMIASMRRAAASAGTAAVSVEGIPSMWFLRFTNAADESHFLSAAFTRGVLFKRGAYNFPALSHDTAALAEIEHGARDALTSLPASDLRLPART
jgi:glutamate-1-semialdehyde 2,1-aminomutase